MSLTRICCRRPRCGRARWGPSSPWPRSRSRRSGPRRHRGSCAGFSPPALPALVDAAPVVRQASVPDRRLRRPRGSAGTDPRLLEGLRIGRRPSPRSARSRASSRPRSDGPHPAHEQHVALASWARCSASITGCVPMFPDVGGLEDVERDGSLVGAPVGVLSTPSPVWTYGVWTSWFDILVRRAEPQVGGRREDVTRSASRGWGRRPCPCPSRVAISPTVPGRLSWRPSTIGCVWASGSDPSAGCSTPRRRPRPGRWRSVPSGAVRARTRDRGSGSPSAA